MSTVHPCRPGSEWHLSHPAICTGRVSGELRAQERCGKGSPSLSSSDFCTRVSPGAVEGLGCQSTSPHMSPSAATSIRPRAWHNPVTGLSSSPGCADAPRTVCKRTKGCSQGGTVTWHLRPSGRVLPPRHQRWSSLRAHAHCCPLSLSSGAYLSPSARSSHVVLCLWRGSPRPGPISPQLLIF